METDRLIPDRSFLERPVQAVARDLLGCWLCREQEGEVLRWQIMETEAYDGPDDKACHAHRGRTPRTEVMFGEAGRFYVYLCYGIHWLLNIVTGPREYPAAVLIRAAGELHGPGRVTKALAITGEFNQTSATEPTGLWVEQGKLAKDETIISLKRVGVNYAGPVWSEKRYRYIPSSRLDRIPKSQLP